MPARERESIRFVLIPFSAPPFSPPRLSFPCPQPRWVPRRPPRWPFLSSQSTFSSLSTSRRNKCAPTRIFKKAVSYPRSARLRHHLRHLRLPTLARATASPPNTAVSRHRRAFSSVFFPRVFSGPVPLFSHLRILHPLGRAATAFQITPRSPISFLFVLPFSSSVVLPLFSAILLSEMAYASAHLPPSPPADLCHLLFFIFLIRQYALYARLRRMRERGEQTR